MSDYSRMGLAEAANLSVKLVVGEDGVLPVLSCGFCGYSELREIEVPSMLFCENCGVGFMQASVLGFIDRVILVLEQLQSALAGEDTLSVLVDELGSGHQLPGEWGGQ